MPGSRLEGVTRIVKKESGELSCSNGTRTLLEWLHTSITVVV